MAVNDTTGLTLREIRRRIRTPSVCGHCGVEIEDTHFGTRLGEMTTVCSECCGCPRRERAEAV